MMTEYNERHFLTIGLILGTMYNYYTYQNNLILVMMIGIISYYYYTFSNNTEKQNFVTGQESIAFIINKIKDKYKKTDYIHSDLYQIFKKPKNFKYLQFNSDFHSNLLELQFVEQFDDAGYLELLVIVETFLKNYYQGLKLNTTYDNNIETMKSLEKKINNYFEEIQITISKSKHYNNKMNIVRKNVLDISKKMKDKISLIKLLHD